MGYDLGKITNMINLYSQFGCSGNFLINREDKNIKLIIDPPKEYFNQVLFFDRQKFDKLILLQGMEPKELNFIDDEIISKHNEFDIILTSSPNVLKNCKNSKKFLGTSSWILTDENKSPISLKKDYHNIFSTDKKFMVSYIMSQKNHLPGHRFRHKVKDLIKKERKFELFFPTSIPINQKYKLFEKSMFHIAIENTKNLNYISEKILDCFMSFTIPIYWGSPNINEYFDINGIITFNDEDELDDILNQITPELYNSKLESIKNNYQIAYTNYAFWYDRINEIIKNI